MNAASFDVPNDSVVRQHIDSAALPEFALFILRLTA